MSQLETNTASLQAILDAVNALPDAGGGIPDVGTALNDCSWEQIAAISAAGRASEYFSVGDRKAITIKGTVGAVTLDAVWYCYIIGIDHNSAYEGRGIHFQCAKSALSDGVGVAFVDAKYGASAYNTDCFHMTNGNDNTGGWASCFMRNTICAQFLAALPEDLQSVIKDCNKYTDNVAGGNYAASNVTATADKIWLPAVYEITGNDSAGEKAYQEQYAYYAAGNTKVLYQHTALGSTANYWTRSPSPGSSQSWCRVTTAGAAGTMNPHYGYGFTPCFVV